MTEIYWETFYSNFIFMLRLFARNLMRECYRRDIRFVGDIWSGLWTVGSTLMSQHITYLTTKTTAAIKQNKSLILSFFFVFSVEKLNIFYTYYQIWWSLLKQFVVDTGRRKKKLQKKKKYRNFKIISLESIF